LLRHRPAVTLDSAQISADQNDLQSAISDRVGALARLARNPFPDTKWVAFKDI